jgi:hypothetical protein
MKDAQTGVSVPDSGICDNHFKVDEMTGVGKGFEVRPPDR